MGTGKRKSQNPGMGGDPNDCKTLSFPLQCGGGRSSQPSSCKSGGTKRAPPLGHCSWKRSQQNAQEVLGPCTAPAELGSSNTVPGETESRCRSDLVHSAGLTLQPGNTNSSGNLLQGQKELRASPTLTRRQPPQQQPGKGSPFSSCVPAGGTAGPASAAAAPQRSELKFPNSHAVPTPTHLTVCELGRRR